MFQCEANPHVLSHSDMKILALDLPYLVVRLIGGIMKRPLQKLSLLVILVAAFTSCQPKKNSVRAAAVNPLGAINGVNGITGIGNVASTCMQGESTMGAIIDSSNPMTFSDRVKALLTATMYPQDVGTVGASLGDSTGVRFTGSIYLDTNGNVNGTNSNIKVMVYDSIWLNDYIVNPATEGIPLDFNPNQGATLSGNFNVSSGQGYLLMKDSYGEIRFDGTITATTFAGSVTFRNYTNITGQSAASGSLGQFTISSCGIIRR